MTVPVRLGVAGLRLDRPPAPSLIVVERTLRRYARSPLVLISDVLEPLLLLGALAVGIGSVVGAGPFAGAPSYAEFVAPGLLAVAALNSAVADADAFFQRLRYARAYETVVLTPMSVTDIANGEVISSGIRVVPCAVVYVVVSIAAGFTPFPMGLLIIAAATLVALSFASVALMATAYMRTWQDWELLQLATMPMFLFSATFFPLSAYPVPLQVLVQLTPLCRAVHLVRSVAAMQDPMMLADVVYLATMGAIGLFVVRQRMSVLLTR